MRVVQRLQQLAQDRGDFWLVAGQLALRQMPMREIRHRIKQEVFGGVANFVNTYDAGVLQPCDGAGFIFEARAIGAIGQCIGQHHLQRNLAIQRDLLGQIYGGHAALANNAQQLVAVNAWKGLICHCVLLQQAPPSPPRAYDGHAGQGNACA